MSEHITAQAVDEALRRIEAVEDREDGLARYVYENHLLELVYQVPPPSLPEVIARLALEPDPSIRARILGNAAGPLLGSVQEQGLTILCDLDDNVLEVALRLVAALDDDLQSRALLRVRRVPDAQSRAEMLADLTVCLSPELRKEVTRETLAITRAANEDRKHWALSELADRLPEEGRVEVLSLAREIKNPSIPASALAKIGAGFADPVRTEVARETLRLLPEVPEGWRRVHIIADLARELPDAVQEEAVAAVGALVEEGQQPAILCKLAVAMAEQRQREVYDQAVALARHIENKKARVDVLAELCEYMPSDQRATLAKEGWETLNEITSAQQQQDDIEWRLRSLRALIPHLPEELAARAAEEALEMVKGQPDSKRQRWSDRLQFALDQRKATPEADSRKARSKDAKGQPQTIFQRDLKAIRLVTRMHQDQTITTLAELRECLEAVARTFEKNGRLRQLIRCQTDEMSSEVTAELLGVVKTRGSEPLYIELSEHLTGAPKSNVLCQGLAAATDRPGNDAFLKMVTAWREKQFDPDVGRSLFPSLLAEAAGRERHELMGDLSAMIPLMAHLYGRSLVDATFKALQDVTAWWP